MSQYKVDVNFYKSNYPDLQDKTDNELTTHYLRYGITEGRVCSELMMRDRVAKHTSMIQQQARFLCTHTFKKDIEVKINILIRTCGRPELFKKCIESIYAQKYLNYRIIVCYDREECLEYLSSEDYQDIECFFVSESTNTNKYKFNLYCNKLMDKVEDGDGYIMFLDDDDILLDQNALKTINECMDIGDTALIWKFARPDKIIYPLSFPVKFGEIDTTSVCFHSKFKNLAKWGDKQYGDWKFYSVLFRELPSAPKVINYILTGTTFSNKIAGFGDA